MTAPGKDGGWRVRRLAVKPNIAMTAMLIRIPMLPESGLLTAMLRCQLMEPYFQIAWNLISVI